MSEHADIDLGRTVRLTIPAKAEYITLSRLALAGLSRVRAFPDETLADLKLALTEACSNSVRHAYGDGDGHVDISFELRDDRLIVEVADDGCGFEHEPESTNGDERADRGRPRDRDHPLDRRRGRDRRRAERQGLAPPLRQAALAIPGRLSLPAGGAGLRRRGSDLGCRPMSERRKLIVVSNRGPISYGREGGERIAKRGAGGLVTALAPLVSHHDVTWIASAISDEDRAVAASGTVDETARDGSRYRLRLVAHRPSAYDLYYNVIANPALWFVQHGLWELKHDPEHDLGCAWDEGYVPVNRTFADAVVEELEREPDAAVLFHDYHLYVAPALVRKQRPDAALAHFTHIPWVGAGRVVGAAGVDRPSDPRRAARVRRRRLPHPALAARVPRRLPRPRARAGRTACDRASDLDRPGRVRGPGAQRAGARPRAGAGGRAAGAADPPRRPHRPVEERAARAWRRSGCCSSAGPTCAAASACSRCSTPRARTSPSTSRSCAGSRRPQLPSRPSFPGALTLRIADDFPASIAAYKQFDVLLVNAVMDGLNLVAKEAPVVNTRGGAVALSVNAGAFEELGDWVVPVEPLDVSAIADALEDALALGEEERRARQQAIRSHVREHDLEHWIAAQLADLDRASSIRRR